MKTIGKVTIFVFFIVTLTSCNRFTMITTINPANEIITPVTIAETVIIKTAAVSSVTQPSPTQLMRMTSSVTPSDFSTATPVFLSPPPDKLEYAMTTAQDIYTLLPYINNANLYGEYSGCVETNDFQNLISYPISNHLEETIKTAFTKYFETEQWEFTEAVSSDNDPTITSYEVYRISSNNVPTFERLKVVLYDETEVRGTDYVFVRVELTHIETEDNFTYISNPYGTSICPAAWLWIRLDK